MHPEEDRVRNCKCQSKHTVRQFEFAVGVTSPLDQQILRRPVSVLVLVKAMA